MEWNTWISLNVYTAVWICKPWWAGLYLYTRCCFVLFLTMQKLHIQHRCVWGLNGDLPLEQFAFRVENEVGLKDTTLLKL